MNVIHTPKKYSDAEIDHAFMQHIAKSFEHEHATEDARELQARKEARDLKGTTHPVLGKPIAVMPTRDFFRLTQKYGHETVHSKEFLQYFNKTFKDLSPNRI